MIESTYKGSKILQFDLLLDCKDLFHAVFLRETSFTEVEMLLQRPMYKADQIHSNLVCEAPAKTPCDALTTQEKEVSLMIAHADCQAAIFYDPMTKSLAVVHAGWRGLVQRIYTSTLNQLKKNGVDLKNILVGIGPSLGPEKGEFKGWIDYFPPHFAKYIVKENHFNLREAAREELLSEGILPHHMEIATECTASDASRFYSWRRDKTLDRHATVASMRKL